MKVTGAAEISGAELLQRVDVVIVGSGAGGAVMAYELARQGLDVVVLEAGPHVPSSEFGEHMPDAMDRLYADGGSQLNADRDMTILQGRCVGGSTTVNAVVTFPIPDWVLGKWAAAGIEGYSAEELAPLYARIASNLSIHQNAEHEINRNSQLMRKGAQALGWSVKPLQRNVRDCVLSGYCLSGCRYDRKQSMLVTYLPWAAQLGARIYADATVENIRMSGGRATGVDAVFRDPDSGEERGSLQLDARLVVVSAGAIQSPLLLQKSGIGNEHVGRHLACHPSISVLALFDEKVDMWNGAQLGVYVDEFDEDGQGGFLLEGGGIEPTVLGHVMPGNSHEIEQRMARIDHVAGMVELIHDRNVGRVYWADGEKRIEYRLDESDKARIRKALKSAAQIWFAAGAREVYIPTVPTMLLRNRGDISLISNLTLERNEMLYSSYHPQGSCRMGSNPTNSVVDSGGRVHGVENLVVADASVFPTSVMVNTQLPTYVVATRIAEQIKAAPARYGLS